MELTELFIIKYPLTIESIIVSLLGFDKPIECENSYPKVKYSQSKIPYPAYLCRNNDSKQTMKKSDGSDHYYEVVENYPAECSVLWPRNTFI